MWQVLKLFSSCKLCCRQLVISSNVIQIQTQKLMLTYRQLSQLVLPTTVEFCTCSANICTEDGTEAKSTSFYLPLSLQWVGPTKSDPESSRAVWTLSRALSECKSCTVIAVSGWNSHNDLLFLDIVITVICFDENCIINLLLSLALAGFC